MTFKQTVYAGAAGLAFALAACGGGGETADETADTASDAAETVETAANDASDAAADAADDAADAAAAAADDVEDAVEDDTPEATPTAAPAQGDGGSGYAALTGDPEKGRRVFTQCQTCHAVQEGQNRVGPSLYGIVGREAGTVEGFRYSNANKNSGVTWTEENLFTYLENPREFIPGTIMAFPGLRSAQDRADVIAYLKSASES